VELQLLNSFQKFILDQQKFRSRKVPPGAQGPLVRPCYATARNCCDL